MDFGNEIGTFFTQCVLLPSIEPVLYLPQVLCQVAAKPTELGQAHSAAYCKSAEQQLELLEGWGTQAESGGEHCNSGPFHSSRSTDASGNWEEEGKLLFSITSLLQIVY